MACGGGEQLFAKAATMKEAPGHPAWHERLGDCLCRSAEVTGRLLAMERLTGLGMDVRPVDEGQSLVPPLWCRWPHKHIARNRVLAQDIRNPIRGCRCKAATGCAWGTVFVHGTPVLLVVAGPLRNQPTGVTNTHPQKSHASSVGMPRPEALRVVLQCICEDLSRIATACLLHGQSTGHRAMAKAITLGRQRFGDPGFGSAAAAKGVGYSRGHFCVLFRQEVGLTFSQWLRRVRVEKAVAMLADPACKVIDAAMECGFGSVWTLDRAFRECYGHPPRSHHGPNERI